jgi:hypothetical protein
MRRRSALQRKLLGICQMLLLFTACSIEVITAVKDIVLAAAGAVTACAAVRGLNKWRQELEGKARFDAARGLLRATLSLRAALRAFRSRPIDNELAPDHSTLAGGSNDDRARAVANFFTNRREPLVKAIVEFEAQVLEAEALLMAGIREKSDKLRICVAEVVDAMYKVTEDTASKGREFVTSNEYVEKVGSTLYETPTPKDNPLSRKIEAAVSGIENEVKKHLGRR